jgi:hypothetical protein
VSGLGEQRDLTADEPDGIGEMVTMSGRAVR